MNYIMFTDCLIPYGIYLVSKDNIDYYKKEKIFDYNFNYLYNIDNNKKIIIVNGDSLYLENNIDIITTIYNVFDGEIKVIFDNISSYMIDYINDNFYDYDRIDIMLFEYMFENHKNLINCIKDNINNIVNQNNYHLFSESMEEYNYKDIQNYINNLRGIKMIYDYKIDRKITPTEITHDLYVQPIKACEYIKLSTIIRG